VAGRRGEGQLRELARVNGIQLSYRDVLGHRRRATNEALAGALRALGVQLDRPSDTHTALLAHRKESWGRRLEPVIVAWRGRLPGVRLRLPSRLAGRRVRFAIRPEGETEPAAVWEAGTGEPRRFVSADEVDGVPYFELELPGPDQPLALGYHRLTAEIGREVHSSLVISAPVRAFRPEGAQLWGVFLPLYALSSEDDWGTGDFTDLAEIAEWVGELGGGIVATLPLMATFLDEPFEPSPYSAASRLFWNDEYIDPTAAPELEASAPARALLASRGFRAERAVLRAEPLVDHRAVMSTKRKATELLSETFFSAGPDGPRWEAFQAFVRSNPAVQDYAKFRAACERHRRPWTEWPAAERGGRIATRAADGSAHRYHLYAQWLAEEQVARAADRARAAGTGVYFDMPLGVNPASYDVWRERDAFALDASAGAPPDPFFTGGQDWGFPPLHPERIRGQGYSYPIACLRRSLRHAGVLRLDHVMGFHRLYWVPKGHSAADGVYVRYRHDEWYAILALESHRSRTALVGEDLGTVPSYVRRSMAAHGILRSWVLHAGARSRRIASRPPRDSLATLNTHDMWPFAAFWKEKGDALTTFFRRAGQLQHRRRPATSRQALTAALDYVASSPARMVLVNLEDLWLETARQNVPGTTTEYPNWRRRTRYPFERIKVMPTVKGTLTRVDRLRKVTG
jgi:4-alpha-glucanotransferase